MKREDRAGLPAPAVTSPHLDSSRHCARVGCENGVKRRRKFCSSECFGISRRKAATGQGSESLRVEMENALDRVREAVAEG